MRLKLGILGLVLFGVITVLEKQLNMPPTPEKTLLFLLLSLVPITLIPYLFVDELGEMKNPKKSALVLTIVLILELLSAAYNGDLNSSFILSLALLLCVIWLITVGKTSGKGVGR